MKKNNETNICLVPVVLWIIVVPLVVITKNFANPLIGYPWYNSLENLADLFLYYKSQLVTLTGVLMLVLLIWQISKMRRKDTLLNADTRLFIPILIYALLAVASSLFSEYGYFCTHGIPDQFETVWNLLAYVVALLYFYYIIMYHNSERPIFIMAFIGAALVSLICVLQYCGIDIYRIIYPESKGYIFSFAKHVVYGPFYNINYVAYYVLLFAPLFFMLCMFYKDLKVRIISGILVIALLISLVGAESSTGEIAIAGVAAFTVFFLLIKNVKTKKILWIPIAGMLVVGVAGFALALPKINAYIQSTNTEKKDLENIFTNDDNVELDYKGQKLYIQMVEENGFLTFLLKDQNQADVAYEYNTNDEYYFFTITDERFSNITLTPALIEEDVQAYGFIVQIDEKSWNFTNQLAEDGTYYYYSDEGKLAKLTAETPSADFAPLVNVSSFANGRGYLWNKTITLLKDYIILGSGADTFTLVYPNDDFVDKYNNGYDNMVITKPHNLYLQIAVQTGMLSLICFIVFYMWYFISSLRIYFKQRLDNPLAITGFSIMLGTLGYMISGIANDSTITIAPLYWAMMGIGIAINHRIKTAAKQ